MKRFLILTIITGFSILASQAQNLISDVIITTDSTDFSLSETPLQYKSRENLYFVLNSPNEEVQISVIPDSTKGVTGIRLLPSSTYEIIDSLTQINGSSFTGTIRFNDVVNTTFPRMVFQISRDSLVTNQQVSLYPFIFPKQPDLKALIEIYNGQELSIPLNFPNQYFVEFDNRWHTQGIIEYKIRRNQNGSELILRSNSTGTQNINIEFKSIKPFIDETMVQNDVLFDLRMRIRAVSSRVNYLNFVSKNYFFEPQGSNPIMVQFEYNRNIELNTTYRLEDQEQPGGRLIAEIYTRAVIENQNKVVANLRTYALHRESDGLLYIKKGDLTKFYTNFNIRTKPNISKISILRPGQEWATNSSVYPSESVELKIEGEGLSTSTITLSDGKYPAKLDTTRVNDHVLYYEVDIPADVEERSLPVSLNGQPTSHELLVREHSKPRPLDFVSVNYGAGRKVITGDDFIQPALFQHEIGNINIHFDASAIDNDDSFYGIQYLKINVRYWDKNNKLIEQREIENIKIVPDETSPRHIGYDQANASNLDIKLNEIMVNKTYNLRPWSKIELTIQHESSHYGGQGRTQRIEIYRSDNYTVDIEVSFPAGLLAKNIGEPGVGSLTGLSIASMAQISFYKKNMINKLQPLKLGLGFIALNAFSSLTGTDVENNDIGIVALMSFQPLKPESKVNFPIYAGFGYLLKSESLFILIGPGVRFNF